MKPTPTAAAYVRVSTSEQAQEGISLEAQTERVRAYCAMRGLVLEEVFMDAGVSAGRPISDRPEGARLLSALRRRKNPVRHVVAFKLDRLFRSTLDCLDVVGAWTRDGVALHLVDLGGSAVDTSNGMGRFFLTMLAGLAELERAQIGERTAAALTHLRDKGLRVSRYAPLGSRHKGSAVVVDAAEQRTVRRILELHSGGLSVRKIAAKLNDEGATARGAQWHPTTVQRVLARATA